jgi:hypothetical protein
MSILNRQSHGCGALSVSTPIVPWSLAGILTIHIDILLPVRFGGALEFHV